MSGLAFALLVGLIVVLLVVGSATGRGPLRWFGRLPGDVRVERPGFRFYLPITSAVLASVVLSLLLGGLGPLLALLGGAVSWFGRLPGDVRVEFGNGVLFVPITSMLLISVGLSVVVGLVRWLRGRGRR